MYDKLKKDSEKPYRGCTTPHPPSEILKKLEATLKRMHHLFKKNFSEGKQFERAALRRMHDPFTISLKKTVRNLTEDAPHL